jgi:hypothetical protein
VWSEAKIRDILPFEVERDGLTYIGSHFVKRIAFRDNREIETFGDVPGFAAKDPKLYRAPQREQPCT